jgi:CheY-like chemotaxis protein
MPHRTIMIIDDTPDHRDILGRLLRAVGYRVVEAAPGEEALAMACNVRPDLILTALSLPGQPAWETARLLRNQPTLAKTPILGATLYNTLLPWSRVRAIGCSDFIDKPFDIDDLLYRITALLPTSPHAALAA